MPGPADASASSFQAYGDSTRCIRHDAYVLRLDLVKNQIDRSDATFHVTP